jgi:hypothetical protein
MKSTPTQNTPQMSTQSSIFETLGSILFIADHKSPNWVSIQYDNTTQSKPPASLLSPFYTRLGSPPIQTVYNTPYYLVTSFTRKSGEVTRVIPREDIDSTVKKEINRIIDSPNILYQDKHLF